MAKKLRRISALLVSVCMVSGAMCLPVLADDVLEPISYYDSDASETWEKTEYEVLDENTTEWKDGTWYYLDRDITYDVKIQVSGANLILKDGCTLTANAGIEVDADFCVYDTSELNKGKIVTASDDSAGIQIASDKQFKVYSGSIDAAGADGFAGIGGATAGSCGYIYIYGGNISAQGGAGGAGIGAGSVNGYLQFSGGSIEARAGAGTAPGIGYWDRVYRLVLFEPVRIDAYGGSEGGPGIGYCGNGDAPSLVELGYTYGPCEKGYVHSKGSKAFSTAASYSGTYFGSWEEWKLCSGENGEKDALATERDTYFETLDEVWIKPCTHSDESYEDIVKSGYSHKHKCDCQFCSYQLDHEECHVFDTETHMCVCGHKEYPVNIEGCPNGYEIIKNAPPELACTDGYLSSGLRLSVRMDSDDLGDIYCAKMTYIDPKTSSEVVLYNDSLDYASYASAYSIAFFSGPQRMDAILMPEAAVNIQVYEKYAVSFSAGEGSGTMGVDRACPYKDYLLPSSEFTAPEGLVFAGWKVNNDDRVYLAGENIRLEGDTRLTAVYAGESSTPSFTAHSLVLSGQIGVRFYVKFPDGVDPSSSYMDFRSTAGKTVRMPYSSAKKLDDGTAVFTFYINSLELADTVIATLHYGENGTIGDVYSAMDYINAVMDDTTGKYDDEKELVNALWGYGYHFQTAGWSDGRSHARIPSGGGVGTYDEDLIKSYINRFSKEGTEGAGINDVMYSLTLTSDTTLHFYISLDDDVTVSSVEGATASGEVTIAGKKYLKYSIKGILPQSLNVIQKVTITTSSGTATLRACPMSYVYDVYFVIRPEYYDERFWKQGALIQYYFYHRAALDYYNAHNTEG